MINLGVQGFETVQEEKVMRRYWSTVRPDLVILGFSRNDPNLRYRYYSAHGLPLPTTIRERLQGLLTFRLLEKIYDPAYRRLRHEPTHEDEIRAAYDVRSRDWQLFQQSVNSLGTYVLEQTGCPPIVICLCEVDNLRREGVYPQIVETFKANSFIWVEVPQDRVRHVSRFEGHPDARSHRFFARALLDKIDQMQIIDTRDARQRAERCRQASDPSPFRTPRVTPPPG